ncbi:CHAT domain-containing tetratricopeptide repeat protein [Desmonostoc muscorum LEGE 12446]|uniref:CHAT domain-containing protein n=1 Tax=Desmonostoc muscorum LEGE 12446 TaxID=1828758 RepID=A0A8J6ZUC3_DESMC|nr:CHAT domain-containing tetratricopeptide repeat protein [Desmonostoc muscorum]MCF2151202.1 CHAT domain-containing tetratricopeptide repeat protein [Desmonostoc muscorum LEGE 12446]
MTQREPKDADGWFERGKKQYWKDRNYEGALASFNRVIELVPNKYTAWNYKGYTLRMLGRHQEAIASCNKALEIKPDFHQALNNRGLTFDDLEYYQDAVLDYNKALTITHNKYHQAWNNRGNALKSLRRYREAIDSYDRALRLENQYWRAWRNRGWALFYLPSYQEALKNWDDGLHQLKPKTCGYKARDYQEGCGELHNSKGLAQYLHGQRQEDPFPHWRGAVSSYEKALNFLTFQKFPSRHLEVLQALIKVCRGLGEKDTAQMLESEGSELLGRWLQETQSNVEKISLSRKFAAFNQYRVDSLAQSGQWDDALKLAEQRKNLCLRWLRDNRWVEPTEVGDCVPMSLVNAQRAAIYWHISPSAITTFILKGNQPPIGRILTADSSSAGADRQLQKFEEWEKTWKFSVEMGFKTECGKLIDDTLPKLAEILDIPAILSLLEGIKQLILIPHRNLHLLPLHALFPDEITITYLPSIQVGIDLQTSGVETIHELPLLSIEHPETPKSQEKVKTFDDMSLLYAEIESAAITQLYQPAHRLTGIACTLEALIRALQNTSGILHFTGHAYHNIKNPADSALLLANTEQLRLKDIFENKLDLSGYHLICLSACETGKTGKQGLIDEFVGLSAGFISAGASCLISTLWRVDEISAALLMIRFYQLLQEFSPAVALKQAQLWLRDATYGTLSQWCLEVAQQIAQYSLIQSENLEDAAASFQKKADTMDSNNRPYAHAYYWAAFTITGNVNR